MHQPPEDDWFADPAPSATVSRREAEDAEDWLSEDRGKPPARGSFDASSLLDRRVLIPAAIALAVLLAILAVAGVFSSGSSNSTVPPAATTTTPPTTTAATTTTTPAPPAARPPTSTLAPGATGAQVKALQRALASLGFSVGKADGDYGPATKRAVAAFQRAHHLTADGVVGPKTLAALRQALSG